MPPRRSSHLKNILPVPSECFESAESRRKRLRPDSAITAAAPTSVIPTVDAEWVWGRVPTSSPLTTNAVADITMKSNAHVAKSIITRSDAPVVRNLRRGSVTEALEALRGQGLETLVTELLQDRNARSSVASNRSLLKTWSLFHDEAFRDADPPLPLLPITVRSLVVIGALFKKGGYRSYPNYVSAIRGKHIEARYEWDQLLHHTSAWVTRSVLRGIGPARQSCALDFGRLRLLARPAAALADNGPEDPITATLLGVVFLLREIELSTTIVSSVTFNTATLEVTWLLPGSKSDHMALGVSRTLGCHCDIPKMACPYHLARQHADWLQTSQHPADDEAPFFPAANGRFPTKAAVVDTFERIGEKLDQPLVTATGMRRFGGHTARVTGCRLYAENGAEVNKIRILARHSGDTILRYVGDTPLRSLKADLGIAAQHSDTSVRPSRASSSDASMRKSISALTMAMTRMEATICDHADEIQSLAVAAHAVEPPQYLQHPTTATIHVVRPYDASRFVCGYKFRGDTYRTRNGRRKHKREELVFDPVQTIVNIPGAMLCERCLRVQRAAAFQRDLADADISGDEF